MTDEKQNAGPAGFLASLIVVTLIGGGGGFYMGSSLLPDMLGKQPSEHADPPPAAAKADGAGHHPAEGGKADHAKNPPEPKKIDPTLTVVELPPIMANLSGGAKQIVRLQSAILFDGHELKNADALIAALRADVAAYLATLDLAAIEGADGLRRLQEELNERAATRSDAKIREFIIEGIVIQ